MCVSSGSYDIYVGGKRLGSYNDTGFFGELALMYNQPRAATIIAASPGMLWAMVSQQLTHSLSHHLELASLMTTTTTHDDDNKQPINCDTQLQLASTCPLVGGRF